jgi:LPS O-antigen subunit length determinant protein (WzzB/FepE family)
VSQRQIDANRINGALGGPKTWAGKQISKMNAERHGFTSQKLVLTTEEEPHFNALLEGYLEELNPKASKKPISYAK